MELHSHQQTNVGEIRSLMQAGCRATLLQAATGYGKTVVTAHMLKTAAERSMGSWFICHRRELIKQSIDTFNECGVPHGVIAAGFAPDPSHHVQIASIGTLINRYDRLVKPKLIIWDEAHHVAAGSWTTIFRAFPNSYHIGLSATPARLDGRGLGDYFQQMVRGPSVAWLIENGYLSRYKLFAPTNLNLNGVHTRMGDFVKSEISAVVDKPTITGDAIREYNKRAAGQRALAFCVSIEHSRHVAAQFNAAGIPALHVDGETPTQLRDQAIRAFKDGSVKVLSNVDLFGEGFDLPAAVCGILLRPTQSLALYLQHIGRVLRTAPGKEFAIILDHVGNCERHGLPDEDREWTLKGREINRRGSKDADSVKVCPKCFAVQLPGRPACGYCGHTFEVQSREVDHVDGELTEVDVARMKKDKRVEQLSAESLADLVEIGRKRGYKRPHLWAKYVFNGRQAKKLRG